MPLRATVPVPNYKALLASVSFLALLTTGAGAEVRGLRLNAGSSPVTAATGAASASAQQAAAIAKQSMDSLTRAAQAIQAMQTAQAAARNLAAAAGSSVPNGLTPGGLQLAPG